MYGDEDHPAIISIHAPVKGATSHEHGRRDGTANFNPRSREGSDCGICARSCATRYFNPRSREGSDSSKS